jgi:DNA-directed RNA polymerase sigma subunit (sigma70/sigma32)
MKTTHSELERGGLTLEECGRRMRVSRERIRQIESEALAKLRRAFHRAGYTDREMIEGLRDLAAERGRRGR